MSQGPYDSLNLGLLTDDAPENVRENRRRLGQAVGHPWERFCYGRQVHGATVRRATEPPSAARPYTEEDGQATALDDAAAIVFIADCLPVLLAAPDGAWPRCTAAGARWPPGSSAKGVKALRELGVAGPIQAAIGPARAAAATRSARRSTRGSPATTRAGGAQPRPRRRRHAQLEAGRREVHDTGAVHDVRAGRFFSHRRDRGVTGRQAGVVCRA